MSIDNKVETKKEDNRYLVYRVGGEVYATPLLDVREVVQYQEPKYMPNMENYFSGVINIRGSIVGVVDLCKKFNFDFKRTRLSALLICESELGAIAAVVDQVDSVMNLNSNEIEYNPPIASKIEQDYLIGVAKVKDQLISIINLKNALKNTKLIKAAA